MKHCKRCEHYLERTRCEECDMTGTEIAEARKREREQEDAYATYYVYLRTGQ